MGPLSCRQALAKVNGVVLLALCACDQRASQPAPAPVKPLAVASASSAPAPREPEPEIEAEAKAKSAPAAKALPPKPLAENEKDDLPVENSRFLVDGLNDVGPAAPASAFAGGVVMVTRTDELALSKLQQPISKAKKPVASAMEPTTRSRQEFWPVARGPAVSATHAYWVSKGRVVRRALGGGELEVLAADARDGTRVAVAGPPDAVAYITRPEEKHDSRAMLRLEGGKSVELTPEGSAASSVSLFRLGDDLIAGFIDGRSGMTPVHARRYRAKTGKLDPDVVVWVAGATQGMTELGSASDPGGGWLFMPVEKDVSHFGLATLALGGEVKMDPPLRWRTYENGLDRAPAAGGLVCGAAMTVYVRPADARPSANQELVVSALTLADTASSEVLATARGFADVSLYPLPEGAVLAYVADRRTWARLLRCK